MDRREISVLEFALLGLLAQGPLSGYDLRRRFVETPMKHFSDSPGSIYPALARLRRKGLVAVAEEQPQSRRRKTLFRIAPAGLAALRAWIAGPVTRADVVGALSELKLRFAFSASVVEATQVVQFLEGFQHELRRYAAELAGYYRKAAPGMSLTGRLALENGLYEYRANVRWARSALAQLKRAAKTTRNSFRTPDRPRKT
jgi:DNA-binding PadR family transcriptional regulator